MSSIQTYALENELKEILYDFVEALVLFRRRINRLQDNLLSTNENNNENEDCYNEDTNIVQDIHKSIIAPEFFEDFDHYVNGKIPDAVDEMIRLTRKSLYWKKLDFCWNRFGIQNVVWDEKNPEE